MRWWVAFKEVFTIGDGIPWAQTLLEYRLRTPVVKVGGQGGMAQTEGACQQGSGSIRFPPFKTFISIPPVLLFTSNL